MGCKSCAEKAKAARLKRQIRTNKAANEKKAYADKVKQTLKNRGRR